MVSKPFKETHKAAPEPARKPPGTGLSHAFFDSHPLLKAVADGFDGCLYVCGPDFRLIFLNAQCRKRVGRNAVGEICYKAIHGRQKICPFCVQDQVQRGGDTVRFEMMNPKEKRWYQSINAPVALEPGRTCLLAMITDIDDRKRAEIALREAEISLKNQDIFEQLHSKSRHRFGNIVGRSPAMQSVYESILQAAASDATAVIYGEPGTGKELVAHAIHEMSERRDHHFVPVHCGAIPENLIESEFFGYQKGAFSGAVSNKSGYIDYADGGTLFLDEVGEISLHMQVKLLRVIEGGGYTPMGSNQVKSSNVRIIAATNRDLKARIQERLMREDFFYRIHILPIRLPPLRQRKEDIPLLIDHFISLYAGKRNLTPISGRQLEQLMAHDWPGNVREFQNVIIRHCNQQPIDLMRKNPEIPPGVNPRVAGGEPMDRSAYSLSDQVGQYEKKLLVSALNQNQWHRTRVADVLKIDRKTLFNKMRRHGLIQDKN